MTTRFDAIIIGTGQAGPSLAGKLDAAGRAAGAQTENMKVAVLERHLVGGTCVNAGCIPTKALVASAPAAHMARRGADFGVVVDGEVSVDMPRVKARIKKISGHSSQGLTGWLEGMDNATLYHGHGRFESPTTVRVGDDVLEADKIFVNVGGRPFVPDMPRDSGRRVLIGKMPMKRVGRARERSETQGFIKILVDADSEQILGAAILGINGDEAIHCLLDVMYAQAPYTTVSRAVHIHPTVAELLPTVLQDLKPLE